MTSLRSTFAVGALLAVMTSGAATANAQMGPGGRPGMGHGMMMGAGPGMGPGMRMGPGMGMGMGWQDPAQALAAAKTSIAIKPEQTAAWDAYAKIVTETAAEQRKMHDGVDRDAVRAMKPEEHQAFRETMMKHREEAAAKVKAAAETLLAALDDAQKTKARTSLPGLAGPGAGFAIGHGMMGPGMMGPRFGMGQPMEPGKGQHSAH